MNKALFKTSKSKKTSNIQRTLWYTQKIKGHPQEIFPLLCPQRECEWLSGWDYEMIFSISGFAEENCVFKTKLHGKKETYWIVSRYEPTNYIIEFVRFTPDEMIVRISIKVQERKVAHTPVDIAYTFTGLNDEQNEYLKNKAEIDFRKSMAWWEKSMNHFLQSGEMLHNKISK